MHAAHSAHRQPSCLHLCECGQTRERLSEVREFDHQVLNICARDGVCTRPRETRKRESEFERGGRAREKEGGRMCVRGIYPMTNVSVFFRKDLNGNKS